MNTIKYNSTGHDVDVLQTLLDIPHNPAHEFNKTTYQAVIDFQKRNGLEADGIVGYKTWEALFFHGERPKYGITESDFDRAAMLLDCERLEARVASCQVVVPPSFSKAISSGSSFALVASTRRESLLVMRIFFILSGRKPTIRVVKRNTSACSVPDISMKMLPTPRPHGACSRSWVSTMLPVVSRL